MNSLQPSVPTVRTLVRSVLGTNPKTGASIRFDSADCAADSLGVDVRRVRDVCNLREKENVVNLCGGYELEWSPPPPIAPLEGEEWKDVLTDDGGPTEYRVSNRDRLTWNGHLVVAVQVVLNKKKYTVRTLRNRAFVVQVLPGEIWRYILSDDGNSIPEYEVSSMLRIRYKGRSPYFPSDGVLSVNGTVRRVAFWKERAWANEPRMDGVDDGPDVNVEGGELAQKSSKRSATLVFDVETPLGTTPDRGCFTHLDGEESMLEKKRIRSLAVAPPSFKCEECGKDDIPSQSALTRHMQIHFSHRERKQCNECESNFSLKCNLDRHVRNKHGKQAVASDVVCNVLDSNVSRAQCGSTSAAPSSAVVCVPCRHCEKVFTRQRDRNDHEREDHDAKPFACEFCNHTSRDQGNMLRHRRTHTGHKPYKCNYPGCDYATGHSSAFTQHKRSHTHYKPYKCDRCRYRCAASGTLTIHQRTHTGERPYKCDWPECTSSFTQTASLEVHRRQHTGERPFKCTFPACEYASPQQWNLEGHVSRWHTPEAARKRKVKEQRLADSLAKAEIPFEREVRIDFMCATDSTPSSSFSAVSSSMSRSNGQQSSGSSANAQPVADVDQPCVSWKRGCRVARVSESQPEPNIPPREVGLSGNHFAQLDFCMYTDRAVFCTEVDEHQHDASGTPWGYTVRCDMARMGHVQTSLTVAATRDGRPVQPIVWVRYNPDAFTVDGVVQEVPLRRREERLFEFLRTFQPPEDQPLTIVYFYYDCVTVDDEGSLVPVILTDEEYDATVAQCVLAPVVDG